MVPIRLSIRRPLSFLDKLPLHSFALNHSSFFATPYSSSASAAAAEAERCIREGPRHDWTRPEIKSIYDSPLLDLLFHGAQVHRHAHNFREVQQCTLLSIKTGGCSEDCSYCPQSSRYNTGVKADKLMAKDSVLEAAKKAKEAGSTRFCMGAAWRDTIGRKTNFNQILDYVKQIRGMGMEVCCTLGMLEKQQALELKKAGLTAYNHNLDTSREYYPNIITTRTYDDRLETLENVREAGISVCSGGIIGLGEADDDRIGLLHTLATLPTHPESVPINALVAVKGTPLEDQKPVEIWDMIRMIATARIVMPEAMVRLSAGRVRFSMPEQTLCFLAGANSIFTGEKLLTTPNNDYDADQLMFKMLGLIPKPPKFLEDAAEGENTEEALSSSDIPTSIRHDQAARSLPRIMVFEGLEIFQLAMGLEAEEGESAETEESGGVLCWSSRRSKHPFSSSRSSSVRLFVLPSSSSSEFSTYPSRNTCLFFVKFLLLSSLWSIFFAGLSGIIISSSTLSSLSFDGSVKKLLPWHSADLDSVSSMDRLSISLVLFFLSTPSCITRTQKGDVF
nr:biotin synthase [Ipomoea batatas]